MKKGRVTIKDLIAQANEDRETQEIRDELRKAGLI